MPRSFHDLPPQDCLHLLFGQDHNIFLLFDIAQVKSRFTRDPLVTNAFWVSLTVACVPGRHRAAFNLRSFLHKSDFILLFISSLTSPRSIHASRGSACHECFLGEPHSGVCPWETRCRAQFEVLPKTLSWRKDLKLNAARCCTGTHANVRVTEEAVVTSGSSVKCVLTWAMSKWRQTVGLSMKRRMKILSWRKDLRLNAALCL